MSEKKRREGFRKEEEVIRLEGMDHSGVPRYEWLKTRSISGETSYEQGRKEILDYYLRINHKGEE